MFNNITQQVNIGGDMNKGVFNEFVAPISDEAIAPKKDSVKMVMIVVLILTILLAVGSVVYTNILKKDVEAESAQLDSFNNSSDVITLEKNIDDMRSLSQRLKLLNSVYDSRLYVSGMLFPILEDVVESSRDSYVYFNKFSVKKESTGPLASVSLSGVAIDYPTLYRQVNNFKEVKEISNFKLSNFSLDDNGNVLFDVNFLIDISTPAYLKFVGKVLGIDIASTSAKTTSGPLFKNNTTSSSTNATTSTTTNINKAVITTN